MAIHLTMTELRELRRLLNLYYQEILTDRFDGPEDSVNGPLMDDIESVRDSVDFDIRNPENQP